MLVSDGHFSSRYEETTRAANAIKSTGQVSLYAVAIGADPDLTALAKVASSPSSRYLLRVTGHSPNNVTTVARLLLDSICNQ